MSLLNAVSEKVSPLFLEVLSRHRQWPSSLDICKRLNHEGFDAVLAGGCVRDAVLGKAPNDLDIATSATPDDVERIFAAERPVGIGKAFGVILLPYESGPIEIATFRKDGEYLDGRHPDGVIFSDRKEDAQRRDFTVNALFYDPNHQLIYDYVGGLQDIRERVLRAVGDPRRRFQEDRLRMLRAVRFSGQLDFTIAEGTAQAIRDEAILLLRQPGFSTWVSRERIRDEIDKMLFVNGARAAFMSLSTLGLGELVFDDWLGSVLPARDPVFQGSELEVRRLALFHRSLRRFSTEVVQAKLSDWKYGRTFVDTAVWMMKSEKELRVMTPDPIAALVPREDVVSEFRSRIERDRAASENNRDEARLFSAAERDWMSALELWTDRRAAITVQVLDTQEGINSYRDPGLRRRGLEIGVPDGLRARASDFEGLGIQGPALGRELRRLSREILLKVKR